MKNYNYKKAKQLIFENIEFLNSASLGMHEDWFWTAETVWENGNFLKELPDNADELEAEFQKEKQNGLRMFLDEKNEYGMHKTNPVYENLIKHKIGGLYGSNWATPTLQLCFKDGKEKMIACHNNGISDGSMPLGLFGELSKPVQENLTPLSE